MATAGPAPADEDTCEMPDAWRRHLHPRRDRPGPWPEARVDALPDQTLRAVALTKRPEQLWMGGGPTASFADLDPVTVSEILADLSPLS